ncbi:unnamed protein product [Caenorhabditis sp. 36 PRJEB53466]|nr:unnamed protein product [Caenorhabditis sp. 36 PRJEB53466]
MQLFEDLIHYFDTHRYCFLFCDPNHNYDGIYDVFKFHEEHFFGVYRVLLYVIGGITNVFSVLTCFIHIRYGHNLNNSYRHIMLFNIFLPVLLTNHVCFLFQPYVIAPHFILYIIGPIRVSFYWTAIQIIIFAVTTIPLTYFLFTQLSYHAFIIIRPQNTLSMFWVNIAWFSFTVSSVSFTLTFLFLAIDRQHYRLEARILSVDPRYEYVIANYAPYIVDMNTATVPMIIIVLEAIYAIVLFAVGLIWAAFKILRAFQKNRSILSQKLTKVQKKIVLTLLLYTGTYLGLLGFPSIAAGASILTGAPLQYLPISALYFTCCTVVAISFCAINLSTVSPYRQALHDFFYRFRPLLIGSRSSSTATVFHVRPAIATTIRDSLFTREWATHP